MNWTYIAVAILAYLLGSIPFGYVLVRLFRKQDIRTFGSGNIGATNVARSGGKALGILTLVLDALKGFLAIVAARFLLPLHANNTQYTVDGNIYHVISFPDMTTGIAIAAVLAILGHVFPVWLKFKGGKGVATGLGVFVAIAPKAVGAAVLIFAVVFALFRYVSLASILSAASFPIIAMLLYRSTPMVLFGRNFGMTRTLGMAMWFVSVVIIAKHGSNIERLMNRTEPRFGTKKLKSPEQVEKEA
jgi:glycerol-3-phosphate acyltransferase PlsY